MSARTEIDPNGHKPSKALAVTEHDGANESEQDAVTIIRLPEGAKDIEILLKDPLFRLAESLRYAAITPEEHGMVDLSLEAMDLWRSAWRKIVAEQRLKDKKAGVTSSFEETVRKAVRRSDEYLNNRWSTGSEYEPTVSILDNPTSARYDPSAREPFIDFKNRVIDQLGVLDEDGTLPSPIMSLFYNKADQPVLNRYQSADPRIDFHIMRSLDNNSAIEAVMQPEVLLDVLNVPYTISLGNHVPNPYSHATE